MSPTIATPAHRLASTLALALLLVGCAGDEELRPVGERPTAPPPPEPEPPPEPPPPKRTVVERDPFGNVAERENLLWDGDFEWASPFADQYGWFEPPSNPTVSEIVAGAACRSGIKCARLAKNRSLVGIGVGSVDRELRASVWVKLDVEAIGPAAACSDVRAYLFSSGGVEVPDPDLDLAPDAEQPDAEGWCHYGVISPVRRGKVYLLVRNRGDLPVLVDDAVIARLDPEVALSAKRRAPGPLDAEARAALSEARVAAVELARPQEGRPNPARAAFERRKRGPAR